MTDHKMLPTIGVTWAGRFFVDGEEVFPSRKHKAEALKTFIENMKLEIGFRSESGALAGTGKLELLKAREHYELHGNEPIQFMLAGYTLDVTDEEGVSLLCDFDSEVAERTLQQACSMIKKLRFPFKTGDSEMIVSAAEVAYVESK